MSDIFDPLSDEMRDKSFVDAFARAPYTGDERFMGFPLDTPIDEARRLFKQTWNHEPERIFRGESLILAGPVRRACDGT